MGGSSGEGRKEVAQGGNTERETANMKLFVRDSVETQYSRSFLKYI